MQKIYKNVCVSWKYTLGLIILTVYNICYKVESLRGSGRKMRIIYVAMWKFPNLEDFNGNTIPAKIVDEFIMDLSWFLVYSLKKNPLRIDLFYSYY